MSAEDNHSGIPTRAIHEAYLDMQGALKAYREAKDQQSQQMMGQAHGQLQQSVLTFYELLRPHLRHEDGVQDYWNGTLPSYKSDGTPPDIEDGKGIIQVQENRRVEQLNGHREQVDSWETLEDWHDGLGMNGTVRLSGVATQGDVAVLTVQEYQKGLRHLDGWETKYERVVRKKDGFMADKTETEVKRKRVPIDRLKRAARELSDVADKLGALSDFDASDVRTKITGDMIQEVREWEQDNL